MTHTCASVDSAAAPSPQSIWKCAKLRAAYLDSDDCSGLKYDHAEKCHKVCSTHTLRERIRDASEPLYLGVFVCLMTLILCRSIAIAHATFLVCRETKQVSNAAYDVDVVGLSDICRPDPRPLKGFPDDAFEMSDSVTDMTTESSDTEGVRRSSCC
eukprot:TRINITY_DN29296_c0_g1_i3.p2 TRINITY_DN29296_c0_g1~~TRINITY_DN29296_c0_g1_i3.p2  ORF type:complete len:156 (-),score=3.00 TRINITY_DN29296_c0_g1_i3:107-574(-)